MSELVELPPGWVITDLESIRLNKSQSITPNKTKDTLFESYSVPSYDTGEPETVKGGEIKSNKQIIADDTVLLCKINPKINRVWITDNFSSHTKICSTEWIPFFKQTEIYSKYILYFLRNTAFRNYLSLNVSGVGGSLTRIKPSVLSHYLIPLPPLNEQKRIVSKIEELFLELDNIKNILQKVKLQLVQYRQSLLKSAFDGKLTEKWRKEKLDELESIKTILEMLDTDCVNLKYQQSIKDESKMLPMSWKFIKIGRMEKFVGSGITPKGGKSVYRDKGIPFIRSQNVYPNRLHLENVVYVSNELHNKMSRTHIQDYDVLLNITGASIGRANFIPSNFGEGNVNQHVCIIRCHSKVNHQFFCYWINSPKCQNIIFSSQQGQTRQGINYSQIRDIVFPICSLEEQNEIVSQIEQGFSLIDNTEFITDSMLQQLDTLRSSILKHAFEGKLVPQDPNDEPAENLLEQIKKQKQSQKTKTKSRGKK